MDQSTAPISLAGVRRVKQPDFPLYAPQKGVPCTYFLQATQGGLVKVGGTTNQPMSRLRAIQLCSPVPLEIIAVAEGLLEADAHQWFSDQREYGEWFRCEGNLKRFLGVLERLPSAAFEYISPFKARYQAKPAHGLKLSERRREIRKSMDLIETETNGAIYKQLLYRVENGMKRPESMTIEQAVTLANALEWSLPELNDALGTGFA